MFQRLRSKMLKNQFLFEELVKRDFKQKYTRSVLGMAWSVVSPLLNLLIMSVIFTRFFGGSIPHYTIYLFCGNLVFSYFRESTIGGMNALMGNAHIFSKVNVPKYMFLLSKNVSALINFGLTLCVFFIFCIIDQIQFGFHFFLLLFPIICLVLFNVGVGLILSALFVFFKDTSYLYDIFVMLLSYMSAIFYQIESYSITFQRLFLLNPVYCYIRYFRMIVLNGTIPSVAFHGLCAFYAVFALTVGALVYVKFNHKFLYYV